MYKKRILKISFTLYLVFLSFNFYKLINRPIEYGRVTPRIIAGTIYQSLQAFKAHSGKYPSSRHGLEALLKQPKSSENWRGPYIDENKLLDAWGRKIKYLQLDESSALLIMAGSDGELCTQDDLAFPRKDRQFWFDFCKVDHMFENQTDKQDNLFIKALAIIYYLHGYDVFLH